MRFDPTHYEPLSATPVRLPLAPLPTLPRKPRLPWKETPFATVPTHRTRVADNAAAKAAPRPDAVAKQQSAAPLESTDLCERDPAPQSARLGRAELRTLLAIDLEGGEVCARREGARMRYERIDAVGDTLERYPAATVRSLIAAGHLRLKRCAHGGEIYRVVGEPVGRAAYRQRPGRG